VRIGARAFESLQVIGCYKTPDEYEKEYFSKPEQTKNLEYSTQKSLNFAI
jgi:hypothetical protein